MISQEGVDPIVIMSETVRVRLVILVAGLLSVFQNRKAWFVGACLITVTKNSEKLFSFFDFCVLSKLKEQMKTLN